WKRRTQYPDRSRVGHGRCFGLQDNTFDRRTQSPVASGSIQCLEPPEFRHSLSHHVDQYRRNRSRRGRYYQYLNHVAADTAWGETELLILCDVSRQFEDSLVQHHLQIGPHGFPVVWLTIGRPPCGRLGNKRFLPDKGLQEIKPLARQAQFFVREVE